MTIYVKYLKMSNYAVVHWFNYRKELSAGFIKGFDDLDQAKKYAYKLAENDVNDYEIEDAKVITEDEITDENGPGKYGSPYANWTIVGYGGRYPDGYCTTFYCVVPWFSGVENSWDFIDDSDEVNEKCVPRYEY